MESFSNRIEPPLIPFLKEPWTSQSKYPTILIVTFLYGVNVVMFGYCTIILAKRKVAQRILLATLIALFLLASGDIAVTLYFYFRFALSSVNTLNEGRNRWSKTLMYKFALYIIANAIASGSLISRCYNVWQNKRILIAPIVLTVSGTGMGFASIKATQLGDRLLAASFITSAAGNLGVTLLIAFWMWWSLRKVRLPRMDFSALSSFVASLILDTGAIYSLSIVLYLVLHTLLLCTCLTQVAGIAVTAIILRSSHSEPFDSDTTFGTTATPTQSDIRIGSTT